MRKITVSLLAFISIALTANGQLHLDDETMTLVEIVKMLRISNEANFNKATKLLSNDLKWTPMNETGNVRDVECKASDKVTGFKLNRILSKVEGSRKFVTTHGDMVNGEDTRFDYSLYERRLKAKSTVNYQLKGRSGKQTFVIIAYNKTARLKSSVKYGDKEVCKATSNTDGIVELTWDSNLPIPEKEFTLTISNETNLPQPFVIINHNTRKK